MLTSFPVSQQIVVVSGEDLIQARVLGGTSAIAGSFWWGAAGSSRSYGNTSLDKYVQQVGTYEQD